MLFPDLSYSYGWTTALAELPPDTSILSLPAYLFEW